MMMKTPLLSPMVVAGLLILACAAQAEAVGEKAGPADTLFDKAMSADAAGNSVLRDELLRQAVRVDPEFQLARWHLGQIFFQDEWQSISEISQLVSRDPRWQEYRLRRDALDESLADHAELARWCRNVGLEGEEKWHWVQVLKFDPDHREALGSLGLKRYRGGLYTDEQIAALRQQAEQAEDNFKRFRKELKRLTSLAERGTAKERSQWLSKIAAISDPAAIDALMHLVVEINGRERSLKPKLGQEKAEHFVVDVSRAAVEALSNVAEQPATLKLVEIAVLAPRAEVRHGAAEALRHKPQMSYMPLLMASLSAPIESSFSIDIAANGLVTLVEDFYESGPETDTHHVRSGGYSTHSSIYVKTEGVDSEGRRYVTVPNAPTLTIPNIADDFNKAALRARNTQQRVAEENATREWQNARIQEVLEITTGQQLGTDPKVWWTAWQEYNELSDPNETPIYESYEPYDYAGPDIYPLAPSIYYLPPLPPTAPIRISQGGRRSCFVAGTPVWTQSGPRPIEEINVGDLVLSQDPISGRLDYRPVVGTTIRPPTGVMKLSLENETIVATRGHRFWITGNGWRMAKFLSRGDSLYSGSGSVRLRDVVVGEDTPAHNLIVGEFHTYFVGNSRLLVHDNNCPLPNTATVPGSQ